MNVTFHVVGNTAAEVRRAAEAEICRFFDEIDRLDWTINCDARETEWDGGLTRRNYVCRVDVFPRHDRGERAS